MQFFLFQRILRINSKCPWPVHWSSHVIYPERMVLPPGDSPNPGSMPGCYIQAINGIIIGSNSYIGPGVKIISANHDYYNFANHTHDEPIEIGCNYWIGADAIILPGVHLADHTIVGAGAVVTKSVNNPNCIVAGIPARIVKYIDQYDRKALAETNEGYVTQS